jgi:hypothetical protein
VSLVALASSAADLHFAPARGTELRKTFEERTSWSLKTAERIVGGNPQGEDVPAMSCQQERRLVVLDRYVAVEDGVPTKLARELETIEGSCSVDFKIPQASDHVDLELHSDLAGAKLVFERKDAKSAPVVKFADEARASAAQLDGLREDLDLRAFLTETGLDVGDHWTVDAATLIDVLAPGGDVHRLPQHGAIRAGDLQVLTPVQAAAASLCSLADGYGKPEGDVLCTWKQTKKDGDDELAVIEIEWDGHSHCNLDEPLERACKAAGVEQGRELSPSLAWTSEGKGQLVWDLKANHAHSFVLQLESRIDVRISGGEGELHYGLEAKSELKAEFEAK